MSIIMSIKWLLRRSGYDLVRYRPFYDTVVRPAGIRTILDIGANDGAYAREMRALFPEARVHAFEPLRRCAPRLSQAAAEDSNIEYHPFALGDSRGEATISRSSFHPSSSLRRMNPLHKALYPKSAGLWHASSLRWQRDTINPCCATQAVSPQ
jgi:hypothetical protein